MAFPKPDQIIIAPSLLSADFSQLATELRRVERAKCPWIHLDVMDNHFVPNLTFGAPVVKSLRPVTSKLFFDAHLMVQNPMSMLEPFVEAGVDNLTIHQEACSDQLVRSIKAIKAMGIRAGVSIKPKTPVSAIEEVLGLVDLVLVMTVEPGFGGQSLIASCLNKVRALRRIRDQKNLRFLIEVDGGINSKTIELAVAAGAEVLVAGSAVFANGAVKENVETLRKMIHIPART